MSIRCWLFFADSHSAADAASHLFFAYLRTISPDLPRGLSGISSLPIALQSLVQATEYPPEAPSLLQFSTTKVVMIVETVSPTPFDLMRRAKNFEYRDSDHHLQQFSDFEDPIRALTDECLRVLRCISSTNQSNVSSSKTSTSLQGASWSRFEDIGFGSTIDSDHEDDADTARGESGHGLRSTPHSSAGNHGRPTTPSWADFLSTGFNDENNPKGQSGPLLLPPDKILPQIPTDRGQTSQSHKTSLCEESTPEPGELASITTLDLDDSFWWVWVSSLAGEEPVARKAVFGRCTLIETVIKDTKWLVLEEQVKGAAPEPEPGAYIVEKKRFFSFRKGKLSRNKSSAKKVDSMEKSFKDSKNQAPQSKTSIAPDQHARIQAAAAALQKRHREQEQELANGSMDGGRNDNYSVKTNSVMTLQPSIMSEASQAMKWANNYDKHAYRAAYLGDIRAGTGTPSEVLKLPSNDRPVSTISPTPSTSTRQAPAQTDRTPSPTVPVTPKQDTETAVKDVTSKEDAGSKEVSSQKEVFSKKEDASKEDASHVPEQPPVELPPKKPVEPEENASKKLKKKPGNTGIKGMFGSGKKKTEQPPMKPTGAEPSAVAAARAALEGRAKASHEPPRSNQMTNGSSVLKKKPAPEAPAQEAPAKEPVTAAKEPEKPATPGAPEAMPAVAETTPKASEVSDPVAPVHDTLHPPQDDGPPKTYHGAESDSLSRVDTNEQDAADREFSRFDQGPLVEQPAFVPEDSPVSPVPGPPTPEALPQKPMSPEPSVEAKNDHAPSSPAANPSQDRWAQLRKNAAERAAASEHPGHRSTDTERTDEGETSGEESKYMGPPLRRTRLMK